MRLAPLLALLVLASLPSASAASPASLTFAGPVEPIALDGGPVTVPLNLTLTLEQFSCMEDAQFPVLIRIAGSGAYVTLDTQRPVFLVPADSYLVDPYNATVVVNATLGPDPAAHEGTINLIASFTSEGGGCIAPGGFSPATANLTLRTTTSTNSSGNSTGNFTGEPTPGNGTAAEGNETLGNETNQTAPPEDVTPATPKRQTGSGSEDYIGDYRPPDESSDKSVPAPGFLFALGAVAAALLLRRKT